MVPWVKHYGCDGMFAWKRLSDGDISQQATAGSAEELFESAGFGAVRVDEPLKGYLAVRVERRDGVLVEANRRPSEEMNDDAEKLELLKQELAEGLSQAERGEFSRRSVMDIAREVIAEGTFTDEGAADIMGEAEGIAALERGEGYAFDETMDEVDAIIAGDHAREKFDAASRRLVAEGKLPDLPKDADDQDVLDAASAMCARS